MKTVILAGGLGTRLAEETELLPKPMVKIGDKPILWHIMKYYAHQGFKDFLLPLGYKGEVIKRYFLDTLNHEGNLLLDLKKRRVEHEAHRPEDWRIYLAETGALTKTGGRMKKLAHKLKGGTFMMTYGDGLSSVDLKKLVKFHRSHGKLATVTMIQPPSRFGTFEFEGDRVTNFREKPRLGGKWVSGGFFVLEPGVLDYIKGDVMWEREPMMRLAKDGQLMAYKHTAFWQCMDTLRDKRLLESHWASGKAPWKVWPE